MNDKNPNGIRSLVTGSEIQISAPTLPRVIGKTRMSLLPRTLAALEAAGIATTLPMYHQQARDSVARWVSTAYRSGEMRQILMAEIDRVTRTEADNLLSLARQQKANTKRLKVWDVFTIGTGWSGAVTTAKLNALLPNIETIMVDENKLRGGSFRDMGVDYLFNSPKEGINSGLPGEMNGPNYLGPEVLVQIGDLSDDLYPSKSVAGETFAIDGFDAGPAIPESTVTEIQVTGDPFKPYRIKLIDNRTGESFDFYSRVVILATGQGKSAWGFDISEAETSRALEYQSGNIFLTDEFRQYLPTRTAGEILHMVQDGLAFGGGRDGTNTAIRYIISRLRELLSIDEVNQLSINIYGAHYQSADDFSEVMGTHVYDDLIPFIGKLVKPIEDKVAGLFDATNSVGINLVNGQATWATTFCASAGYTDGQLQTLLRGVSGSEQPAVLEDIMGSGNLEGEIIARNVPGQDIFVIGVAARVKKPKRTGKSLRTFGRAIRKHAPRVLDTADVIAEALQKRQSQADAHEYECVSLV